MPDLLFASCCPCHQVGRGYGHLFFVFSFRFSPFSHCVLYHQFTTPSICSHSLPTVSRSFLTQSSVFLTSFFHPLSGHLLSAHFSLPFTSFVLKTLLHSNLQSQFVQCSLSRSLHSRNVSYPVVCSNLYFLLLFLC